MRAHRQHVAAGAWFVQTIRPAAAGAVYASRWCRITALAIDTFRLGGSSARAAASSVPACNMGMRTTASASSRTSRETPSCSAPNTTIDLAGDAPEYNSCGFKVKRQWKNSAGRNICWLLYDDDRGDIEGDKDGGSPDGGFQSEQTFDKLWKDALCTNVSAPLSVTLQRQSNGTYVFDSNVDPQYVSLGGFFPIDNQLFGNSPGTPVHNFHFTYVLKTRFVYRADGPQMLPFRSDDSLWVFIDGRNVIDLGGVHTALEQDVDLSRLGLANGQEYEIAIFYAERHRPSASLKITLPLLADVPPVVPTISAGFD
ncbi:MAG: hypothetical protein RL354_1661 [Planctomycetota bacterium]